MKTASESGPVRPLQGWQWPHPSVERGCSVEWVDAVAVIDAVGFCGVPANRRRRKRADTTKIRRQAVESSFEASGPAPVDR